MKVSMIALAAFLFSIPSFAQTILAESHFDSDMEGWFVTGGPAAGYPRWEATMGCVPGCIRTVDGSPLGMYFNAPEEYLGDRLAAYGGMLSYCIRNEAGDNQIDAADVVLEGAGLRLGCRGGRAGSNWSLVQVRLTETAAPPRGEWYVESMSGRRPTRCEFRAVLSALESLQVRAEYREGADDIRFDEVQLVSGPPECAGDLDNDGVVGLVDLALLLAHFGDVGGVGDLDCDGGVGIQDLTTLLSEFGSACQ